jgi:GDP-L-fucose synthase
MNKILITGFSGMVGGNLSSHLNHSSNIYLTPSSKELNLENQSSVLNYFNYHRPNTIIHLAAYVGGIGLNKKYPADLTHRNLKMTVNLFDAIREFNIEYFYGTGSVCSYPKYLPDGLDKFSEEDMWGKRSEETNFGYAENKKMMLVEFEMHKKQYGLKGGNLILCNMYGPNDCFDLQKSHVVPALIRKFYEAKLNNNSEVICWGTGVGATRAFLYVNDACEAVMKAVNSKLDTYEYINIGPTNDISILDLANLIAELIDYKGKIVFSGELDGQPKRLLSVEKAKQILGWETKTTLRDGLIKTIEYYKDNREEILNKGKV